MGTVTFKGLPEKCFSVLNTTNEVIIITRGEDGYRKYYDGDIKGEDIAMQMNQELGVTIGQMKAMTFGSMFGWHIPASNPSMYDEEGNFIKEKIEE